AHPWHIAALLRDLGELACRHGDPAAAAALFRESLAERCGGDRLSIAAGLEGLAFAAAATGKPEPAARLLGAAASLRQSIGAPLSPRQRLRQEEALAALRASLGESLFAGAWEAGHSMTWEQALALAPDSG